MDTVGMVDAVLGEALRYLKVREQPTGSNRGVEIDYWMRECGLDPKLGLPWCAAFVSQVGRQALGALWPIPRTASVRSLAAWGAARPAVLHQNLPERGDIFLLWSRELNRFAHTGLVVATALSGRSETIEGNTNVDGSRDGYGVFARSRTWSASDRFLSWKAVVTP